MNERPGYNPSRKPVDQTEDDLVAQSGEAFFEDRRCMFCGCFAFGERPDGRGGVVHDSVLFRLTDGSRVMVALHCVACRPGQVSVCWQRRDWDEVSATLGEGGGGMNENGFVWAGVLAMVAFSVLLIAIAWPVVDRWQDDWRQYAHETRFGGVCTSETPPPECETDPPLERWRLVPWTLTLGLAAGLLALCLPGGPDLKRRRGRWLRRAAGFLRSQR